MPTIEVSKKVLEKLVGRKINIDDLSIAKAECENGDKLKIEVGDTNRPDLWSVEGLARVLRGFYGKKGMPKINIKKGTKKIIVDHNIKKIRPYISGFVAKRIKVTDEVLKDLIQIQEKIADNFGKKRKKISIGIYNHDQIEWPVHYKAVKKEMKFIPLEFKKPMTLKEILDKHPKGIEYGYIIKNHNLYPIFVDSKENVLSFPPIINSNFIGKVETGRKNLFIEVTGTDMKSVLLVTNILAYALYDRGAIIESVNVVYPWKTSYGKNIRTPYLFKEIISFEKEKIKEMLGLELDDKKIKNLLESMQYNVKIKRNKIIVEIPPYRNDVMHYADVIEDLAIAYGYNNFDSLPLKTYTIGESDKKRRWIDNIRLCMIGLGFQEILSPILIGKKMLTEKMCSESDNIVEIENPMTENYNSVRSWLLPCLMNCLSKNLHRDYPQKIFEIGEAVFLEKDSVNETIKLGACISDANASYEDISAVLHTLLENIGIKYSIKKNEHNSFIKGRCASIVVNGKVIGFVGEIHPQVLNNWGLEKPVSGFEIDLGKIKNLLD